MASQALETYTQASSVAEDVQDAVYVVNPVDNPVASMSKTIRATGTLHEWLEDVLPTAAYNAQIEGEVAPARTDSTPTRKSNYTQIMSRVAKTSGTLEAVDKFGRDSEMAYQLEMCYAALANEEEYAIVNGPKSAGTVRQTATAGSTSVARELAGIAIQLDVDGTPANNVVYATTNFLVGGTDITTTTQLETCLLEAHQRAYNKGGNPSYLFVSPAYANYIAGLARSSSRTRDVRNESKIVNVVDLYVSPFGELDVVIDRQMTTATQTINALYLLDFNYLATPVLRPTRDWPLARTGDFDQRQILRESTFAVLNEDAIAIVEDLPITLTVS